MDDDKETIKVLRKINKNLLDEVQDLKRVLASVSSKLIEEEKNKCGQNT